MQSNEENVEPILRVEHLRQYFNGGTFRAVDDVSFDIKKGEVLGLVGESGCGKTTTGRSIIKLYDITGGNIYFKGVRINAGLRDYTDEMQKQKKIGSALIADCKKRKDALGAQKAKKEMKDKIEKQKMLLRKAVRDKKSVDKKLITKIQMIFQDPVTSLDPRMTVREIIAEGLRIQGIKDEGAISKAVSSVLETVGLVPEYADRYPHEFSGGQRQRIGIARAVVMNPELIIADEPVSALDVSIKAQVINLLNDLRKNMGLTILFIAHDLSVVKYFSDRIAVMYFGKIVELASSQELFSRPLHPYTKSLLSAIPLPDPHYEKRRVRIVYQPMIDHDYSEEKPTFREVFPAHFVRCNSAEEAKYKAEEK